MYEAKPLNYDTSFLEPYIDSDTVYTHYNKHYLNYLNKLNNLLESVSYNNKYTKEELVNHIDMFPIKIRGDILYNLGGVLNHELYFNNMNPLRLETDNKLRRAIIKKYGSMEDFLSQFKKQAQLLVGSGYTFLVINKNKDLEILNFSNQETPYSYGLIPILALDLWEHAYYLKYKNNRNEYIDAFLKIVDFNKVNDLYEKNI